MMDIAPEKPRSSSAQRLLVALSFAWLTVFILVPFLIVVKTSFSESAATLPPYAPLLHLAAGWRGFENFFAGLSFDNYRRLGSNPIYVLSYVKSLEVAAFSTLLLLLIGYPIAHGIARTPRRLQAVLIMLVVLPFSSSILIRVCAWMEILRYDGPLNRLLLALHIVREPQVWLATDSATYIGIVYCYLAFMVLPLYAVLGKLDRSLIETAVDLGCPRWKAFWLVTLPLSSPGVLAGALLCFIPIVGEFVIPDLLGDSHVPMIGQTVWMEFFGNKDWPVAAAVAVVLVCLLVTPIVFLAHQAMRAADRS